MNLVERYLGTAPRRTSARDRLRRCLALLRTDAGLACAGNVFKQFAEGHKLYPVDFVRKALVDVEFYDWCQAHGAPTRAKLLAWARTEDVALGAALAEACLLARKNEGAVR